MVGGAAEACEDAAGPFAGRVRVVRKAGAKAAGGDGQGGVVQGTTAAPCVELTEGAGVALAGVRTGGGGDKEAGGRAWGSGPVFAPFPEGYMCPERPPQACDRTSGPITPACRKLRRLWGVALGTASLTGAARACEGRCYNRG